jgi:hypothetical protein
VTFVRKFSGDRTAPIIAVYTCPEHGEFDAEVQRDENGEAPDAIPCPGFYEVDPTIAEDRAFGPHKCEETATWTPSRTVGCRVRRIEAVKGKWEAPERKTFLDTRDLADGMDPDDFREKRNAIWEEQRKAQVMAVKKGFG